MNPNEFRVTDLSHCACSRWQGGTTYELDIGPDGSSYADRNFLWRMSSAAVDLEESVFTRLDDYNRLILPLDAPLTLRHDGNAPIHLSTYEVHCFDGAADTLSRGRAQDFNLMLRKGGCDGCIRVIELHAEAACEVIPMPGDLRSLLFCAEGVVHIEMGEHVFDLYSGGCFIVSSTSRSITAYTLEPGKLIYVRVWPL